MGKRFRSFAERVSAASSKSPLFKRLSAIASPGSPWDMVIRIEENDVIHALERARAMDELWEVIGQPDIPHR